MSDGMIKNILTLVLATVSFLLGAHVAYTTDVKDELAQCISERE